MIKDGIFEAKKTRKLTIKIDEQSYEAIYPKVKHQRDLVKKLEGQKTPGEQVDIMIEFLEDLGLPSSATDELEADDLNALVEELAGVKTGKK